MTKMKKSIVLSLVILLLTGTFGCNDSKPAEPLNMLELTIADIHRAFEEGTLTSVQLVEGYLKRIEHLNDTLNALTVINPVALELAKELDREYRETGILRPLHGIPLIVKDNINTAGLPTTAGALALKDYIPAEDAFVIRKLREAGAIILAKSNMAEWAFSPMHTESSTAGTTRNPYNLDHVPAGSSGGTAASIAANQAVIGLGTDTGNSIRGPSSHCALVGFRTTQGLISRSAIVPLYLRNDIVGPLCRSVEDATRVMEIMAGYDPLDPVTRYSEGKIPANYLQYLEPEGLKGARIGVLGALSYEDIHPEILALFSQALEDMKARGAEIIDSVSIPEFSDLQQNLWCADFRKDIEAFLDTWVERDTLRTLEDIIRIGTHSDYASGSLTYFKDHSGRDQNLVKECLDVYQDPRSIAFREAIEQVMDALDLDALVYPSWNYPPAGIDNFREEYRGDNSQIIAPHTGQPAFTIPMGYTGNNLPAGIQFLGRMFDEPTLLRLTFAYEQATHHRKPPDLPK
ncbi:MAG: amidase [Bacteroides sp.]|jgi:Asp-tRNA(Asn)/Glu-tRNA(Gln) amidotransferase A subunit family amidase|nr:amidase [Bacteroides sp.]